MEFKPENTAVSRKRISAPLEYILDRKYYLDKKYHSAFDYGCGRGKDFQWLKEEGYKIQAWDPYHYPDSKPGSEEKFDLVLCTYVINTIENIEDRKEVIKDAWSYVAPGGFLLISTRTDNEIRSCAKSSKWTVFGDGYISSIDKQTFQKGFTGEELLKLFHSSVQSNSFVEAKDKDGDFTYLLATKNSWTGEKRRREEDVRRTRPTRRTKRKNPSIR
ncbi:MAG: hypothetical protein DRH90_13150 [Deltaproteobacteria bacterium]|nr:MAG: hypothetical protein DRH90_13150 [Deltaproteobacteria bacterium]RLC18208.1 MAG: hypothetical protein DRI24_03695 [Deltaproteobacteria bacterium]